MTLPPLDYTAIILAILSVISTITLGILQFGKWRAEAKKARTEAQTDLVKTALEINKQEIATLREVIEIQKANLKEKDAIIAQTYTSPLKYKETLEENERLRKENDRLKSEQGGI